MHVLLVPELVHPASSVEGSSDPCATKVTPGLFPLNNRGEVLIKSDLGSWASTAISGVVRTVGLEPTRARLRGF